MPTPSVDTDALMDQHRSPVARGVGATWRGARAGWFALPPGATARWLLVMLIGTLLSVALTAALTLAAKRHVPRLGWDDWDRRIIKSANTDWPISFTDGIILESPGNIFVMLPLTLGAAAACLRFGRVLWAASIVVCYGVARGLILFGWSLWDRPRPDLIAGGAAALSTHSFPSGHTLLVCTTYGLLTWFWIRSTRNWPERILAAALLMALIFVVGVARLRLGAHWPTDTIAGAIIGLFWLSCNVAAIEFAERRARSTAPLS